MKARRAAYNALQSRHAALTGGIIIARRLAARKHEGLLGNVVLVGLAIIEACNGAGGL